MTKPIPLEIAIAALERIENRRGGAGTPERIAYEALAAIRSAPVCPGCATAQASSRPGEEYRCAEHPASAPVETLADDAVAIAHVYEAVLDYVNNRPEVADACARGVVAALDAYRLRQRGGK